MKNFYSLNLTVMEARGLTDPSTPNKVIAAEVRAFGGAPDTLPSLILVAMYEHGNFPKGPKGWIRWTKHEGDMPRIGTILRLNVRGEGKKDAPVLGKTSLAPIASGGSKEESAVAIPALGDSPPEDLPPID